MGKKDIPVIVRDPQGINRRDGADRVSDNEFLTLQNVYHRVKGLLETRGGSISDLSSAQLPYSYRVTGVARHYNANSDKSTLYFVENDPAATYAMTFPDVTLAEIAGGNLFNGGAVEVMRFAYTYVGLGQESNWNSVARVGWDATKTDAWLQPGHQSITVSTNAKGVRLTLPSLPSGFVAINIYAARGVNTQMTYVGSVYAGGATFDFLSYLAAHAAYVDAVTFTATPNVTGGSIKPGAYWVGLAPLIGSNANDPNPLLLPAPVSYSTLSTTAVFVGNGQDSISISGTFPTANGAKHAYVFVSTGDPAICPMICVGIVDNTGTFTVSSIPEGSNAQSHMPLVPAGAGDKPFFYQSMLRGGGGIALGYLVKKRLNGTLTQVQPSRSIYWATDGALAVNPFTSDPIGSNEYTYLGMPRTTAPGANNLTNATVYNPVFTYFNGLTYFSNGADIPWCTDGFSLGQITREFGTTLPETPRFLLTFKSQLLAGGGRARNILYCSNALNARNWANGGTGTVKRFMAIGDVFGDDVTGLGVFAFTPEGNNDPRSFFVSMKKHGVWIKDNFPDAPVKTDAVEQISGRVGCTAFRSIVQTIVGLVFLGSDGNVYLVRGTGEPRPIGNKIWPLLKHLEARDDLMGRATAVYHDFHYKLSYPSTTASTYNDAQLWIDMRMEDGTPVITSGPHKGINVGAQTVFVGEGDDLSRVCVLADQTGTALLDQTSAYSDLGTAITSIIEGKNYRFKAELNNKRIVGVYADIFYDSAFNHSALMEMFCDDQYFSNPITLSSAGGVWDGSAYDAAAYSDALFNAIPFMVGDTNLVGRVFRYKFTHTGTAPIIVANFGILFQPERRKISSL